MVGRSDKAKEKSQKQLVYLTLQEFFATPGIPEAPPPHLQTACTTSTSTVSSLTKPESATTIPVLAKIELRGSAKR